MHVKNSVKKLNNLSIFLYLLLYLLFVVLKHVHQIFFFIFLSGFEYGLVES